MNFTSSFLSGAVLAILLQLFLSNSSPAYPSFVAFPVGRHPVFWVESFGSVVVGLAAFILGGFVVGVLERASRRLAAGYVSGVATAEFGIFLASPDERRDTLSSFETLVATLSISVFAAAIGVLLGRAKRRSRSRMLRAVIPLLAVSACWPQLLSAQESHVDRSFVLELGGAGEWDARKLSSGKYGGTIAMEIEPIDGWLELELGVTPLVSGGRTELGLDLLFKKPFTLSPTVEFMVGLGPSLSHRFAREERGTSVGLEIAADFMFWPTKRVGWFVEPTYGIGFGSKRERSLGVTAGLLIGFP